MHKQNSFGIVLYFTGDVCYFLQTEFKLLKR